MAGIMAGRTLQKAGYDVTLLEARDRVGGRTHTDHSLGSPVDLGAAWIHGPEGNPLTPLAEELNIDLGFTDFLNRSITAVQAYDEDGTPLDQKEYAKGLQLGNAAFYKTGGSLLYTPPKNARTLKDWIEYGLPKLDNLSHAANQGFHYQSLISLEYVTASDWDVLDWALTEAQASLPGGDYLVYGGGYNVITDYLAQMLDIRLETVVTQITTTAEGVTVETTTEKMECDRVVITVPLGVLKAKSLTFSPPLPTEKATAIERIGFGNYEKIALQFNKFYWPRECQRFNYLSTGEPSLYHAWLNLGYYTNTPIIVAYHAGRRAQHINKMNDDDLIKEVLVVMQRMFAPQFGKIPDPQAYARSNWEASPYSNGSYSYDRIGQQPQDRHILAEPVDNRLFFAGEASHPHFYATVHGAYETGVCAANKILELKD